VAGAAEAAAGIDRPPTAHGAPLQTGPRGPVCIGGSALAYLVSSSFESRGTAVPWPGDSSPVRV